MSPVALITGGAGDLAQALRAELEQQGWRVHAPGRDTLDVTDRSQVQQIIGALPQLDLLIHNAGILRDVSIAKMTEADFDHVLDVHLRGAFLCAQAALKLMVKQRRGHLLMIGSFSALSGPFGQTNYAAAKAGLIGLTQSLAAEYGPRNIRANCVLPGFLETKMTALVPEAARARILSQHTLNRFNTPQDAARFIAFLHSMENVSGQVFHLDSRISPWT
ncbi:MAG TPA: SDR family NAD(P)-dependent oxidoreductase [Prosthecobacter sp.]|nr:SDR family NAD(P)-dependent oxidoreductase [Prosthecobacter sp.]